jgi:trk system potassium uptake protein TrkA
LKLREKQGITILAIKRGNNIVVSPGPDQIISAGDILVALGKDYNLEKINHLES